MPVLETPLVLAWVLVWFAIVGFGAPMLALGRAAGRRTVMLTLGPALVCSWLTLAVGVPLAAAVHGFNWVTAFVIAAVCPVGLWLCTYRRASGIAFRRLLRGVIVGAVTMNVRRVPRVDARKWIVPVGGVVLLLFSALMIGARDVRLTVPADFDALWRTRQLLEGVATWDPLASLTAVLTRISATNPLHVANAIRLALVALTGMAAVVLMMELGAQRLTSAGVVAPLVMPVLVPSVAAATWAVALVTLIGATSVLLWIRHRRARDGWYALAAFALAAGQVLPFIGNLDLLLQVSRTAHYIERSAAARKALQLDRSLFDNDWILVAPPEQQLEIGRGHFYDLARFVTRFRDRAGDPSFRFDLGARRIYVFVEEEALDPAISVLGGQFVAAQPVSYRVPRERLRLAQLARQICDEYRRTHAQAVISYDDGALRVYEIDR